jgi:hydrogenase-4 component B
VRVFLGLLGGALALVVVARDAVLFLIAFEIMTLSAFFLVTAEDEEAEVRRAGWIYLLASHVSFLLLTGAFVAWHAYTNSFALDPVPGGAIGPAGKTLVCALACAGFFVKAGVMPFHVWLPAAHAAAPSHVSALLSGVVLKVGVYGLLRVLFMLPDPPMLWGAIIFLFGAASGISGVALALAQHDLKRLLAYHSIENIGIITMGIGVAAIGRWCDAPLLVLLGVAAAVMHSWNHALFKSLLFLGAGAVVSATHTRAIDRLGGLWRGMPWTAVLFTVGAVAICGLPPLNGFASELLLYTAAFHSLADDQAALLCVLAPILSVIGALACACFVKVLGTVFLGQPRGDAAAAARECAWSMRLPMLVLAGLCTLLGVWPIVAAPLLETAAAGWGAGFSAARAPALGSSLSYAGFAAIVVSATLGAALLWLLLRGAARDARQALTWDCGYARPGPRMQYSGSSFAATLVGLLGPVVRPDERPAQVQGPFPEPSTYASHAGDPVLDRVLSPLARRTGDLCVQARDRQSRRIQVYIVYILVITVALIALVLPLDEWLRRIVSQ